MSLIRFTDAQSSAYSGVWRGTPENVSNVLVYRVEPTVAGTTPTPVPYDAHTVYAAVYGQGYNTNETAGAPCPTMSAPIPDLDCDLQDISTVLMNWGHSTTGDSYIFAQTGGPIGNGTTPPVQTCIVKGSNCAGGTQDNNYYRNLQIGGLKSHAPVFAVGILHSATTNDFAAPPTAPDNADYTGISIADYAKANKNTRVDDTAQPNAQTEYTVSQPNRLLLGSAYTVLKNMYTQNQAGQMVTLYSLLKSTTQTDINEIYIHIFEREDGAPPSCPMSNCTITAANATTVIQNGPAPAPVSASNPVTTIPTNDPVQVTERGYLLPPPPGTTMMSTTFYTGASAPYLESPYIVCDATGTGCPVN